jgi:hypothetical protein
MCLCGIALSKEGGGFEVTTFARTRFNVTLYVYCLYCIQIDSQRPLVVVLQ